MKRDALIAALDACLATPGEASRLRAGGARPGEDPFATWPDVEVRMRIYFVACCGT